DAAARQRGGLVSQPRCLTADPDLDEDEVGAIDGGIQLTPDRELAREARPVEHPAREPADDLQPPSVDVVQSKPTDLEPCEPRDELGRVGRAGADDGELHPFTPVSVTPSTNA